MKNTATFSMASVSEADALVAFFSDCGISATRKGCVVKASGDKSLVEGLFDKFVMIALI